MNDEADRPGQRDATPTGHDTAPGRPVHRSWYALLVLPFIGLLWPAFYSSDHPRLFGFPFFYWYQFAWVIVGSSITAFVYWVTTPRAAPDAGGGPGGRGVYPDSPDRPGARRTTRGAGSR